MSWCAFRDNAVFNTPQASQLRLMIGGRPFLRALFLSGFFTFLCFGAAFIFLLGEVFGFECMSVGLLVVFVMCCGVLQFDLFYMVSDGAFLGCFPVWFLF